jgi:hypothetical protein
MILEVVSTIGIGCALPITYLMVCKRKIRKELEKRGRKALSIRWIARLDPSCEKQHETWLEVVYEDSESLPHRAVCAVRPFSEVYWTEGQ